jgi:hypothetical protein
VKEGRRRTRLRLSARAPISKSQPAATYRRRALAGRVPTDTTAKPEPIEGVDDRKGASPLGRGADPGKEPDTFPLSDTKGSIAGLRGASSPHAAGGPSGFEERENEDVVPEARHGDEGGAKD